MKLINKFLQYQENKKLLQSRDYLSYTEKPEAIIVLGYLGIIADMDGRSLMHDNALMLKNLGKNYCVNIYVETRFALPKDAKEMKIREKNFVACGVTEAYYADFRHCEKHRLTAQGIFVEDEPDFQNHVYDMLCNKYDLSPDKCFVVNKHGSQILLEIPNHRLNELEEKIKKIASPRLTLC